MPTNVITISEAGVVTDYTRYIYGGVQKTDNAADPNLLDFSLFSYNRKVSMPKAGAYVTITTATYGAWFTGYIITDPEVTYIGEQRTVGPRWAWKYQATSDELVLNKHPLGIIPPFINQTQGQILKQLVAILSPATVSFNVSGIQDGMLLPRYVVDPNQHFSDVVKSFAQSANFRFSCVSRAMTFAPKDSTPLTITVDGANVNFTPGSLRLQPVADSIVNQAIVLGNIEPQNYMNEFFVGDGATAKFALISSVYGADSATLIDDSFTNNTIDDSKWTVYDPTGTVLFPFGGTINAVGGSNNRSYDVSLQSLNLVPLEGTLRLTHGEWDFVQFSSGIIGGLFTGNVTSDLSSLLYGISVDTWRQVNNVWTQISPTTATATDTFNLHPIVNGQVDMNQWAPIDTSKRYIMRTLFATQRSMRQAGQWSFVDATGNVVQIPGGADADTAYFSTYISEVDPNTGQITNFWVFNNTGVSLSSQQTYAYYCPLVVDYCNLTFTSVTVSCPIMAQLRQAARGSLNWVPAPVGPNEIDSYDGLAPVATIVDSNQGATTKSSLLGTRNYNPGQASLQYFSDQPVPIPANTLAAINPDLYAVPNPIRIPWGSTSGNTTVSWANAPSASMELWINGAGVSPGTKVASGGQTGSYSATGVSNGTTFYLMDVSGGHPGNLVVYLTIETEIMYIPQPGDLVWLQYRSAGAAIGFAQDSTSIDNEAAAWGDDGIRSKTVMNIQPLPRTSHDCEIIASAIVQGNSYQHYSGQYTMPSGAWFSGEPQAGTIIKFQNLPADFPSTLQAESVTQVVTTLDHLTPEHFTHAISFGPIDTQSAAMSVLRSTDNVFTPQDTAQIPDVIEISSLGLTTVPDVTTVSISGWDANSYYLAISDPPPNPGGYEVRYSDNGWGADDGHNLVIRTTNQTFAIPRNARGKVCYIRAHDSRNALLYSEDFTQSAWIKGGGTPPTVSNAKGKDPDDKTAVISTVHFPNSSSTISQSVYYPSSATNATFSVSVLASPGATVTLTLQSVTKSFVTTGSWQRLSVSASIVGLPGPINTQISVNGSVDLQTTRASLEYATVETVYCKTLSFPYGALSRFSAGVHIGLPLIPPAPSGFINGTDAINPTLTIRLPQSLQDIWGVEVRLADDATVFYHKDLIDSGYTPEMTLQTNSSRTITYYVHTYNILGEYSPGTAVTFTWAAPQFTQAPTFNDGTKVMTIYSQNASYFVIQIQQPPDGTHPTNNIVGTITIQNPAGYSNSPTQTQYMVPDQWFLPATYFEITAYDALGAGQEYTAGHTYTPFGVAEFNANEVSALLFPANPATSPTVPTAAAKFPAEAIQRSYQNYVNNQRIKGS